MQIEDDILLNLTPNTMEYQILVHNKGIENVKRRRKFLGLNPNI